METGGQGYASVMKLEVSLLEHVGMSSLPFRADLTCFDHGSTSWESCRRQSRCRMIQVNEVPGDDDDDDDDQL